MTLTWTGHLQRDGIDHDPVKPGNLCDNPLGQRGRIASLPCKVDLTVLVEFPIDSGKLVTVPLNQIAAFAPDRI